MSVSIISKAKWLACDQEYELSVTLMGNLIELNGDFSQPFMVDGKEEDLNELLALIRTSPDIRSSLVILRLRDWSSTGVE